MRKALLATASGAALLAAGPALSADMVSVGVSGSMEQWIGGSTVDAVDKDGKATAVEGGAAQQSDSEIHFKGSLEADNGLKFSVKVELEANSTANQIDESQATVSGEFGQVVIGAEDGASVLTHHPVRDAGIGINCGDIANWINGIKGCGPGGFGTSGHGLGDKNKISYYTPRIGGVQAGGSYVPNTGQEGSTAELKNNDNDAWSIGANYVGEFGGANIAVSAGYYQEGQVGEEVKLMSGHVLASGMQHENGLTAYELKSHQDAIKAYESGRDLMKVKATDMAVSAGSHAAAVTATNDIAAAQDITAARADEKTYMNFGLNVGFGAFSFDVAYGALDSGAYKVGRQDRIIYGPAPKAWDHDGDASTPAEQVADSVSRNNPDNDAAGTVLIKDTSMDSETVALGVMYSDGPMAISLSHSMVEADNGDEQAGTLLSGSYTLAPGVVSRTSIFAAEQDNADGSSVEGTGFVTGITISF